jgi:hypothetical protein
MSENNLKIKEGYMPFLDYKVYYRIVGETTGNKSPYFFFMEVPDQLILISKF